MEENRKGKAIGAKLARALVAQFGGVRDEALEGQYPAGSRHQVYRLSDGRVIDVFLKSARMYLTSEEFGAR